jgi:hypothetical protein
MLMHRAALLRAVVVGVALILPACSRTVRVPESRVGARVARIERGLLPPTHAGVYSLAGTPIQLSISVEGGRLMATQRGAAPFELLPTGTNVFTPAVDAPPFHFERDAAGNVATLVVGGTRLARMP